MIASAGRTATSVATTPVSGQRGGTTGAGGAIFAASMTGAWVTGATGVGSVGDPLHAPRTRAAPVASATIARGRRRADGAVRTDGTVLLQGVNRATLYGVTVCGPAGHAPGRTYAERVIRPVRDVPARPDLLLPALEAALAGSGPAVAPGSAGRTTGGVGEDVAVVVRTSGSTGEPRGVLLSATALRASAGATHDRLAGPGTGCSRSPPTTWPASRCSCARCWRHLADRARRRPVPDGGLRGGGRRDGPRRAAVHLARAHAAGAAPRRRRRDRRAPLVRRRAARWRRGVAGPADPGPRGRRRGRHDVRHDRDVRRLRVRRAPARRGRRPARRRRSDLLAGPVLADGYRDRPDLDADAFVQVDGVRHLRTSEPGTWSDGVLAVLGRADDVLVSGGVKIPPGPVEAVVASLPGVLEVCVVGVPDAERDRPSSRSSSPALTGRPRSSRSAPPSPTASVPRTPRADSWSRTRSPCAGRARSTVGPPRSSPSASSRGTPRDDCQRLGAGARPRTLPAAAAPVLVGTGAAAQLGEAHLGRAALALGVALALQVGVNYATTTPTASAAPTWTGSVRCG